jgi:predicted nucleotide-binding protein
VVSIYCEHSEEGRLQKDTSYPGVQLDAKAFRTVVTELQQLTGNSNKEEYVMLDVTRGHETWKYDDFEEFLSAVGTKPPEGRVALMVFGDDLKLYINSYPPRLGTTSAQITSTKRENISRLSNIIDACAKGCEVKEEEEEQEEENTLHPKVFIGHGASQQWRDLKDHLKELHHFDVVAYETGARAGHTIRDTIESMLNETSFAILVMTGEDEQPDGTLRARQNVVHEIGLFQGRLGFTKAVVLLEEGTEEFSNINGVNQIRFPKGAIRQTFGDVLAVLKREFAQN